MIFDAVIVVDWSARSAPSPKRASADAIWIGTSGILAEDAHYLRTRTAAMDWLRDTLGGFREAGRRALVGFDFPFAYPAGFAETLTGSPAPFAVWDWLARRIEDGEDNANNRFAVAREANAAFPGTGPFWGCPATEADPALPERGRDRVGHGLPERRKVEEIVRGAQSAWKLFTTGSVGSQAMLGLPRLAALRRDLGADCAVWPFEPVDAPIVLAEVYPSLLARSVAATLAADSTAIKDAVQVRLLARALHRLDSEGGLPPLLDTPPEALQEGWILGAGYERALEAAARPNLAPPRLKNNCFALPPGVNWVPVDEALDRLRAATHPVTRQIDCEVKQAGGHILATDAVACRSHPPRTNAAVDGYGFAQSATGSGPQILPLHPGRAAAGAPFDGRLPCGAALRILTGAVLPEGVDTVVMEEDCQVAEGHVAFDGPVKMGANTRAAGEDVAAGAVAIPAGRRLLPQDLALLASVGIGTVRIREKLRVAVLSTGDELHPPGAEVSDDGIFDANRPMLLDLAARWGHTPLDLGIAGDQRAAVREALDRGAGEADAILTSGGASAGDEDHVSAILRAEGEVAAWRIALKPGRPLMLGLWKGVPVFGMPGNPVAAFVCALIFARPALSVLAGGEWETPRGFLVPAAFAKRKKPGRREYLRARLDSEGQAQVFASEGSGRVSGLTWADGLVELADGGYDIAPGDMVRYLPFSGFGI